jgi:hypothetical protein
MNAFKECAMYFHGERVFPLDIEAIVERIFAGQEHKKRVISIAQAALGLISSGSLIVHRMGRSLADVAGKSDKHAIKQIDRLLSNKSIALEFFFSCWIPFLVGSREEIKVAMDWTDFDKDSHATIQISLLTSHGRATPLVWKTIKKSELKYNQINYEKDILKILRKNIGHDVAVTVVADRGFGDVDRYEYIKKELNFDYIIRFKKNIFLYHDGIMKTAEELIPKDHAIKTLHDVDVTHMKVRVNTVVLVQEKGMKQAWCIASSQKISPSGIVKWYGKRWGIESQFRDTKDLHFGMGLSSTKIKDPIRRDRILLIHAIATAILTMLGAAGEALGLDRLLKVNTSKKRTLSLFRQGCSWFNKLLHPARDSDSYKIIEKFQELIEEQAHLKEILLHV